MSDRKFHAAWIGANAAAEAIGLGTTLLIAWRLAPALDRLSGVASTIAAGVLAIGFGTLLEGVVVGVAQESVLRQRLRLRRGSWTMATAGGAALAWVLGMIPSTVMALTSAGSGSQPPAEPSAAVQMLLAAGLGLVAGPILGIAQWTVLRRFVAHAGRWLWANALAWAVGMPLIFAGMDAVPWAAHPAVVALSVYGICATVGATVGAIHGRILVHALAGDLSAPATRRPHSSAPGISGLR
jgi:hypothetical protein